MDYQNRVGSKFGGGGVAGASETAVDRRERLRKLALETIDLATDPYILRTHLGTVECRLCLTMHTGEDSYLSHTQGKKHQTNLARRAAKEAKDSSTLMTQIVAQQQAERAVPMKQFIKIGTPGYNIHKLREPESGAYGLRFEVKLPHIKEGVKPLHRFMSSYEQKVEAPNKDYQYLLIAAEPYQTIGCKIPSRKIQDAEGTSWSHFDPDTKIYSFQFLFKEEE